MENIDLTQTVPSETVNYLGTIGMIIVSTIIILLIIFCKRYKARFAPLLMGILAYFLFAFAGYNIIISLMYMIPGFEVAYNNNTAVFSILFLIVFVAMFTAARIICMKIMYPNYVRPGDVLILGLGIGMFEALIYALSSIVLSAWAAGINTSGMTELFKDFTQEEIISNYSSISLLFTAPSILWILLCISAIMDMLLNCGLAILTFGVVSKKIPTWWYAVCAGINFFVILPFKLYDTSSVIGVIIPFAIKTILFIIAVYIFYRMDTTYIGGLLRSSGKNNIKISTGMPKFGKLSNK